MTQGSSCINGLQTSPNWKTAVMERKSDDLSFAKQQLGSQQNESKVLGLPWDKEMDTLTVNFPKSETTTSK